MALMEPGMVGIADPRTTAIVSERPWGRFRQYTSNQPSTVKIITVEPGQLLSLQRHEHRDELWVVLDDGLLVQVGEEIVRASAGDEFFVPRGTVHRAGAATERVRFLEVALGIFDEDDIERLDDHYGRS